eukprot:scaffold7055_cov254-Pinguiococcus_pyrenoidosus.AAC.1
MIRNIVSPCPPCRVAFGALLGGRLFRLRALQQSSFPRSQGRTMSARRTFYHTGEILLPDGGDDQVVSPEPPVSPRTPLS